MARKQAGTQAASNAVAPASTPSTGASDRKLQVFISYARADLAFAEALVDSLERHDIEVRIDRRDLPYGDPWKPELLHFVRGADAVVFIVSPRSIASRWCKWEVEQVKAESKRLVPIVLEPVPTADLPSEIAEIHLLSFTDVRDVWLGPQDAFRARAAMLSKALCRDLGWIKDHTRIGELARRWGTARDKSTVRAEALLLRGDALSEAEIWISRRPREAPDPTRLQHEFIEVSRRVEITGLRRARRRTRITAFSAIIAAVVFANLFWFFYEAWKTSQVTQSLFLAEHAKSQIAAGDALTGALLALEGIPDVNSSIMTQRLRPLVPEIVHSLDAAWRATRQTLAVTIQVPEHRILSLTFSPDEKQIIVVSEDGRARTIAVDSGRQVGGPVRANNASNAGVAHPQLAWLRDAAGTRLASSVRLAGDPISIDLSQDGGRVVVATSEGVASIWDTRKRELIGVLDGHVRDPMISPDGRSVIAARNGSAYLWRDTGGMPIRTLPPPQDRNVSHLDSGVLKTTQLRGAISRALFSSDGRLIATISGSGMAQIWNVGNEQRAAINLAHEDYVVDAAFSPNGHFLATASQDNTARIWRTDTGALYATLSGHRKGLRSVTFSPSGLLIATIDLWGDAFLWKMGARIFVDHESPVIDATITPDGRNVLMISQNGASRGWDAINGKTTEYFPNVRSISPGGRLLVSEPNSGLTKVCEPSAESRCLELERYSSTATTGSFSRDSSTVIGMLPDGTGGIWDARTGKLQTTLRGPKLKIVLRGPKLVMLSAVFFADQSRVLGMGNSNLMHVWDAASGEVLFALGEATCDFSGVDFSPDNKYIATTCGEVATVWDARSGKKVRAFRNGSELKRAVFSSDSRRILTAPVEAEVQAWSVETGEPLVKLIGHKSGMFEYQLGSNLVTGGVTSIVFSPDRRLIVTAAGDATLRLWDPNTGAPLATLEGHTDVITNIGFSLDGRQVVTTSRDGTARLWATYPVLQDLIDHIKSSVRRCLSPEQRNAFHLEANAPQWCRAALPIQ